MSSVIRIPEKDFFTFEEICDRWELSREAIWDLVNRSLLRPMVLRSTVDREKLKRLISTQSEGDSASIFGCVSHSEKIVNSSTCKPIPKFLYIPAFSVNPAGIGIGEHYPMINVFTNFSGEAFRIYGIRIPESFVAARQIYDASEIRGFTPSSAEFGREELIDLARHKFKAGPLLISREERDRFEALHNVDEQSNNPTPSVNGSNLEWPWGSYETKWLRFLAAAAKEHWARYDPAKPRTAPTNKKVAEWLEREGVSSTMSQAMATILRDDKLPKGPRK